VTGSHNIVGREARFDPPDRRLVDFSPAHGAMTWGSPRRRRAPLLAGAAMGAAAVLVIAAALAA